VTPARTKTDEPAPAAADPSLGWYAPNQQCVGTDALNEVNPATGATAGIPGDWTPAGATPPATVTDLVQGKPVEVTASPQTGWTTGQYVQTQDSGAAGRACWTGTSWVGGAAP
jgi:hypothetical protein